ncbi:hypothetical protein [Microbulbifer sp. PSTR4-B]|uniref:hypothetical protein n=1 Tax=Microbulbifer sp. PSTR4-B TaxID=3243396 RepID=UPI0040398937
MGKNRQRKYMERQARKGAVDPRPIPEKERPATPVQQQGEPKSVERLPPPPKPETEKKQEFSAEDLQAAATLPIRIVGPSGDLLMSTTPMQVLERSKAAGLNLDEFELCLKVSNNLTGNIH